MRTTTILALAAVVLSACGNSECVTTDPSPCSGALVCEVVTGQAKGRCLPPVLVEGKVTKLADGAGIGNAQVSALDANGAPLGTVAVSKADGAYSLRVPTARTDEAGTITPRKLTLRAQAAGFASFPSGVRVALPIDTSTATKRDGDKALVVTGGPADIGLEALPAGQQGPSIIGTVELSAGDATGVLVAAENGPRTVTTIADAKGAFTLFNVPPGGWKLAAYAQGANYTSQDVTVETGRDLTGIILKKSTTPTATVSGSVSLVASANGAGTSVVLALETTFNANLGRGEVPPGLRAPSPGTAPNLKGAFSIAGVPEGKYVVLAAFENDGNVRDPDPSISGTQVVHITVTGAQVQGPAISFKVTGAVALVSPGAGDAPQPTAATPTFTWSPYSSAKSYDVTVLDSFGTTVWTSALTNPPSSGDVTLAYAGPALASGRVYQWRATAKDNQGNPISTTEDLKGLFVVQ